MRDFALFLLGCALTAHAQCGDKECSEASDAGFYRDEGYELVFEDDFSGETLNPKNWIRIEEEDPRDGDQSYTSSADNAFIQDGWLQIKAKAEGPGQYSSARLQMPGNMGWRYGRFEFRARFPMGTAKTALFPSVFMLPAGWTGAEGQMRYPDCGEITMADYTSCDQRHQVHHSLQMAKFNSANGNGKSQAYGQTGPEHPESTPWGREDGIPQEFRERFDPQTQQSHQFHISSPHLYRMDWTPQQLKFYVNNVPTFVFENDGKCDEATWPFIHRFNFIIQMVIGGPAGGVCLAPGEVPDFGANDYQLAIDFVRVYQRPGGEDDSVHSKTCSCYMTTECLKEIEREDDFDNFDDMEEFFMRQQEKAKGSESTQCRHPCERPTGPPPTPMPTPGGFVGSGRPGKGVANPTPPPTPMPTPMPTAATTTLAPVVVEEIDPVRQAVGYVVVVLGILLLLQGAVQHRRRRANPMANSGDAEAPRY